MTEQSNTSGRRWHLVASWLVLVLFVVGVQYWIGWQSVLTPWEGFSWAQGAIALALLMLSYALRAWRMYDYFPQFLSGQWLQTWRLMLIHNAMNNVLPARMGELSFPVLMRRYFGVGYAHSVSALLWFRALDLHTILAFAVFPLMISTRLRVLALPLLFIWMSLPILAYLLRNQLKVRLAGKDGNFSTFMQKALHGLPDSWWAFWRSWAMTWMNWVVKLATLVWLLNQFVPDVNWNLLLTSVVTGELTSVLPIHAPGGFGTYEAGVIAPLSRMVEAKVAMIAAVNLHLFVLGASLIGALIGWLIPLKAKT